jgi:hypothetical protein
MSKEARSRGACWTCKLRRKKCDETLPVCSACTSLAVPCYGYNPKPAWADGGEKQKAKAEELQIIIRELASLRRRSRKQRLGPGASSSRGVENNDDKSFDVSALESVMNTEVGRSNGDRAITDGQSSDQPYQAAKAFPKLETLEVVESTQNPKISPGFLEYDSQANLLMHYLDVVFPNQFPFYNPPWADGGRGWLLLVILRTKPLYHAALSMAAYHQQAQSLKWVTSEAFKNCAVRTLQTHHSLAIQELRYHLNSFRQEELAQSFEGNIEVLACIVFLISLEVSFLYT